jgi:hypothetical protein
MDRLYKNQVLGFLFIIALAVFIGNSAHSLVFTPKVELAQPSYYPETCIGFPKSRPDLEWGVDKITADRVIFDNGVSIYRDAAIIMGDCDA